MSKNSNKLAGILVGSTLVIAGTALYLYFDENARNHVEGAVNREKAKFFVKHKLNGSDALVKAVDKLSDSEINTLVKLADSADNVKDQASDAISGLVDRAKDAGNQVSDKINDYFN